MNRNCESCETKNCNECGNDTRGYVLTATYPISYTYHFEQIPIMAGKKLIFLLDGTVRWEAV